MIVYWKQEKYPRTKIDEDRFGNSIYEMEEKFAEVIGGMDGGRGSGTQRLIIATPNGKISTIGIDSCYHKSTIIGNPISLGQSTGRQYNVDITYDDDVYTVEEWKELINDGTFVNFDGSGYWVKDSKRCMDEVFSTNAEDATHVAWFNK